MYTVFTTDQFDKQYSKLDSQLQKEISKEIEQLKENPYAGKPLSYPFFREKKVQNYRVYFLIYEEHIVVFVISISTKRNQQEEIDKIKSLMPQYKEEVKKKIKG